MKKVGERAVSGPGRKKGEPIRPLLCVENGTDVIKRVSNPYVTSATQSLPNRRPELTNLHSGPSSAETDPDIELVKRWRSGELDAFASLVRRHEGRVFRVLFRMLGHREDAEEVAQETFLNLHRHGHRFRGESRFSTFVYRVAINAALNRRRSLGRNRARMQALSTRQAAGDEIPEGPRGPEEAVSASEIQIRIHQAISQLPVALRMPIILYDLESHSYAEIAEVLDIAEGTVKSRIHRARKVLRDELGDLGGFSPEARTE